jgi:cyclin C
MATDFWASSHKYVPAAFTRTLDNTLRSKRWIVDRATLKQARAEDLQYVQSPDHIDLLNIYFANRAPTLVQFTLRANAYARWQSSGCWANA